MKDIITSQEQLWICYANNIMPYLLRNNHFKSQVGKTIKNMKAQYRKDIIKHFKGLFDFKVTITHLM